MASVRVIRGLLGLARGAAPALEDVPPSAVVRGALALVVDDRLEMAEMLADGLSDNSYDAVGHSSSRKVLALLESEKVDALVTDLRMPEVDGLQLLAASRKLAPERPVIVMTAFGAVDSAVESIRQGAYHYLIKPFKLEELVIFLGRALLAATHRDLRERVRAGAFREDLLYRLDVVSIEVPPLRHRREDLPDFLDLFLKEARARHPTSPVERFSREALARLMDHAWPGNVRELAHVVERVVLLGQGPEVGWGELAPSLRSAGTQAGAAFSGEVLPIRELQRRYAAWALEQMGGQRGRTAEKLGVDAKTLARWLSHEEEAPRPPSPTGSGTF